MPARRKLPILSSASWTLPASRFSGRLCSSSLLNLFSRSCIFGMNCWCTRSCNSMRWPCQSAISLFLPISSMLRTESYRPRKASTVISRYSVRGRACSVAGSMSGVYPAICWDSSHCCKFCWARVGLSLGLSRKSKFLSRLRIWSRSSTLILFNVLTLSKRFM